MIAAAPGKLFTTGAWAILDGAPAIVLAVNRYVLADGARAPLGPVRPEVAEVARRLGGPPPFVDASALESSGRKLGLGSSAAAAVASAAVMIGGDPRETSTRRRIFVEAWRAHRAVQPRGSGGDLAASTYGGVVQVQRNGDELDVTPTALPEGVVLRAFALDRSARTSDALDRLDARRAEAGPAMASLVAAAEAGAAATAASDARSFVKACAAHVEALARLGAALDLPLVPDEVTRARDLLFGAPVAESVERPVLLPSGAGGGDTVLWLSARAPTDHEAALLDGLGLHPLDLELDRHGVHQLA
ncbi:MAG: hypothetical protein HYV09_24080 [Deltaproteobacteria bacterium]|nr:hypothetical protein [Deltaproteobacteria bacterium]